MLSSLGFQYVIFVNVIVQFIDDSLRNVYNKRYFIYIYINKSNGRRSGSNLEFSTTHAQSLRYEIAQLYLSPTIPYQFPEVRTLFWTPLCIACCPERQSASRHSAWRAGGRMPLSRQQCPPARAYFTTAISRCQRRALASKQPPRTRTAAGHLSSRKLRGRCRGHYRRIGRADFCNKYWDKCNKPRPAAYLDMQKGARLPR